MEGRNCGAYDAGWSVTTALRVLEENQTSDNGIMAQGFNREERGAVFREAGEGVGYGTSQG